MQSGQTVTSPHSQPWQAFFSYDIFVSIILRIADGLLMDIWPRGAESIHLALLFLKKLVAWLSLASFISE